MPRKRGIKSSNYYDDFPERLREIMADHGTTQQELSEYIGKSRQAVGYYADGSESPDWKTVAAIAQYFDVSADWLLGMSDVKNVDIDIQQICKHTGLSESAVDVIIKADEMSMQAINRLFESKCFNSFALYMSLFLKEYNSSTIPESDDKNIKTAENLLQNTRYTVVSRYELSSVYMQKACEALQRILWNQITLDDI